MTNKELTKLLDWSKRAIREVTTDVDRDRKN